MLEKSVCTYVPTLFYSLYTMKLYEYRDFKVNFYYQLYIEIRTIDGGLAEENIKFLNQNFGLVVGKFCNSTSLTNDSEAASDR